MFTKTAQYYDAIYSQKDYQGEVEKLMAILRKNRSPEGGRLLDVACGTGYHIQYLKAYFSVEGLDINPELLDIARKRNPEVTFHEGDMIDFDLDHRFDVVTCLFSSIGYAKTLGNLNKAVKTMTHHLNSGGLLLIEPWFTPDKFYPGTPHAKFIDEPDLKIARVNTSFVEGRVSYFDMHYLIGTPEGTDHFVERHELGLFTVVEMKEAFERAGLVPAYDEEGLMGRGLYVGIR